MFTWRLDVDTDHVDTDDADTDEADTDMMSQYDTFDGSEGVPLRDAPPGAERIVFKSSGESKNLLVNHRV